MNRWLLYVALAGFVLTAVLVADWAAIQRNFFNVEIMADMMPEAITVGVLNTIIYTAGAFTFGFVLALILALMRLSPVGPYRWIAMAYVEFFRGVPALITILVVAFGLPIAFGWRVPGGILGTGSVGLGIVAAAYMAETMRAGIEAVPVGQVEAARSLGMSSGISMFFIVLPQAFRIIIPPLTNELVLLLKDTSLLFVIGTTPITKELTKFGRDFMAQTANATPLTVAAILYLVITLPLTFLVRRLERKEGRGRRSATDRAEKKEKQEAEAS
ncbi:MAG: amino acid ABC transporter permease [Rhodothermales bacterium]|nr:amino acid ABC transporter permease [Rhodothermales bacterium]